MFNAVVNPTTPDASTDKLVEGYKSHNGRSPAPKTITFFFSTEVSLATGVMVVGYQVIIQALQIAHTGCTGTAHA